MSRVLITGGAGFIGCRLASSLLAEGHDVDVLDNLHPQVHDGRRLPLDLPADARFVPGDVTAVDSWPAVLETSRPDVIVHLAAETGTGQSLTQPTRHASVNVLGTAALIEALERARHRPSHIVLASSRAVYGDGAWVSDDAESPFYPGQRTAVMLEAAQWDHRSPAGLPARPVAARADLTRPDPTNVYAATKLAQEHILSAWCQARSVDLSVLRLQNVYGPGQSVTNSYTGVLTFFARTAVEGGVIDVYEDGDIVRDFVYVGDVVAALSSCVARPGTRTLDVGSGRRTTINEVAAMVAALCDAPGPKVSGRYRHGDVRAAWCDISRSEAAIGYRPVTTLESGLQSLVEWVPGAAAGT
jgi:dTDP-L-rhamnose 4-epimerase